ncbi:hypothetical protein EGY07_20965 [Chryseobacterium indologenes]|uniref:Uncharacterized protein n=1 Tax=Chryseobacterium indologenes TaxID=253 RepID=A0AAD0YWW4_CHRID|nr:MULTISPECIES: hypothetical protein [Chryseobacterium]ASE63259.1 hypothetical protein CEQ15_18080 [Chryseobacterium indologenes]ATN07167.1 hypothetical protein CRN76_18025 [Chryseobacterium indologenes]AYY84084.1 hypothetical protein EGX91_05755 [Chryseobacterium indologenes]AYZ37831.1 hypothetical protein EGY07_20965 [Chryseobacterium indologenes]AZB18968.1 hypothetical protein EG352_14860 [Chryseobacterium indologenes]
MKEFNIEKLERKNIYTVPDNLFENIQENVMNDIKTSKKAPVFKLNWMYAAAASLALIFGATYVFNSDNSNPVEESLNSKTAYAVNKGEPKTESEVAYETLKADLTSVENNNQTFENQKNNSTYVVKSENANEKMTGSSSVKTVTGKEETRMNDYLDSFSNTEIAELASNSTQDVYLDLYN